MPSGAPIAVKVMDSLLTLCFGLVPSFRTATLEMESIYMFSQCATSRERPCNATELGGYCKYVGDRSECDGLSSVADFQRRRHCSILVTVKSSGKGTKGRKASPQD